MKRRLRLSQHPSYFRVRGEGVKGYEGLLPKLEGWGQGQFKGGGGPSSNKRGRRGRLKETRYGVIGRGATPKRGLIVKPINNHEGVKSPQSTGSEKN